jgi:uncharacterized protein YndB with AHSA1/START domain
MTQPAQFTTFTIERHFAHDPSLVFSAWTTAEAKSKWFAGGSEVKSEHRELEFRIGGREQLRCIWKSGVVSHFDSRYFDIVQDQRIVYAYDMYVDQKKLSVSLSTVEFIPSNQGCLMKYTEQCSFLDGYADNGSREHGSKQLIEQLANALSGAAAQELVNCH